MKQKCLFRAESRLGRQEVVFFGGSSLAHVIPRGSRLGDKSYCMT